jgi:hypothetical protein
VVKQALDPRNVDEFDGCKQSKNIDVFRDYTAGTIFLVYPCGIILAWDEMYRAESVIHVALLLLSVFDYDETSRSHKPRFVGYDRACDLDPCIANLIERGALSDQAAELFKGMKFMVDRFHVGPHTEKCCDINDKNCKFHPDLPVFDAIRKVNTQIAEQTFRWFNQIKANTRVMTMSHFW